ncbi:MAG: helix-turn-helix domain-containing protein [Desulfomonilaceae bacterium]
MEELVKIGEAAARLGIHYQTLRRWVRDGRGPKCVLTPSNRMCFRESDLRDWTNSLGVYEPVTSDSSKHQRKNPLSR